MLKERRQRKIRELVESGNISSQSDLTALLSKAGFTVNQSSVSRDLDEIGVIKSHGFYALPKADRGLQNFGLSSLETAGENLIVAKCEAGLASAMCVRIDNTKMAEIVGTIAGEDTIFIAVKNAKSQKAVMKKIWELFER